MIQPNYDQVICPNCVTQFRAVPVNVQSEIASLKEKLDLALWKLKHLDDAEAKESMYQVGLSQEREITKLTKDRDMLLAACRQAVVTLAHAAEDNPIYRDDYRRMSDAIDAARAAS